MILISLLIVLSLERLISKTPHWHITWYAEQYRDVMVRHDGINNDSAPLQIWLVLLLPAVVLAALEHLLLGPFFTFIEQTIVLFICIGCPALRKIYWRFLKAAQRGDLEACDLYSEQLGFEHNADEARASAAAQGKSFGQHMTWLNYQHYAAVMLWFIAFGAPGAVFYTLVRSIWSMMYAEEHPKTDATYRLLFALDFIPVRITSFALLMMGHFSRALPEWLKLTSNLSEAPYCLLTRVAAKAEMLSPEEQQTHQQDASVEPRVLVKLAKRSIIFLVVVTAVLTLTGLLA